MRTKTVLLACILLAGTLAGAARVPEAEGGLHGVAWIYPSQTYITADVTRTNDSTISIHCIVSGVDPGLTKQNETPIIYLWSSSSMGWNTTVSPSKIIVVKDYQNSFSYSFYVNETIPKGTPPSERDNLTVNGTYFIPSSNKSYQISPKTIDVKINQFYLFTLSGKRPAKQSIHPGERTTFEFFIKNDGNGRTAILFNVKNRGELEAAGISIDMPNRVVMNEYSNDTISLKTTVGKHVKTGVYTIAFQHIIENSSTSFYSNDSLNLTLVVEKDWTPTIITVGAAAGIAVFIAVFLFARHSKNKILAGERAKTAPGPGQPMQARRPVVQMGHRRPYQGAGKRA